MITFYWHIHHDTLVEPLTEPLEARLDYIRTKKPERERELRLRLIKPVIGALPAPLIEAGRVYNEAWRAYNDAVRTWHEAWSARDEAGRAYIEAGRVYAPAVEALHAQECLDCPWDGETIFPQ